MLPVRDVIPSEPHNCPSTLRVALDRWTFERLSSDDLVEASYHAQLDCLEAYRRLPLPTPPEAVRLVRASPEAYDAASKAELARRYASFFAQESSVRSRNHANDRKLQELLAWAESRALAPTILAAIRGVWQTHHDQAESASAAAWTDRNQDIG